MKVSSVGTSVVAVVLVLMMGMVSSVPAQAGEDDAEWAAIEAAAEDEEGQAEDVIGEQGEEQAVTVTVTGRIVSIGLKWRTLTMTDTDGKSWLFEIGQNVTIKLSGKKAKLADLRVKDEVTIVFDMVDDYEVVKSIAATRKAGRKESTDKKEKQKDFDKQPFKKSEKEADKEETN